MLYKVLVMVFAIVFCSASVAAEDVVIYGNADYAPYSFIEENKFKGIYVDFLWAAAERLEPFYRLKLVPVPFKKGLEGLEKGEAFGLLAVYLRKERLYIGPYSEPLNTEKVSIFCSKKSLSKPRKVFPADFSGLRIGVNFGFAVSNSFRNARNAGIFTVEESRNNEENLKRLGEGKVDCYAGDYNAISFYFKNVKKDKDFEESIPVETVFLSAENSFIGYSMVAPPAYQQDFIEKLNQAIKDLKKEGKFEEILKSYIE